MRQQFGGEWTEDKLNRIKRYLIEWVKVMMNQPFTKVYIDTFAGTGYRELRQRSDEDGQLFLELAEDEPQQLLEGSARIALHVEPEFDRYIFIELFQSKAEKLEQLKSEYPSKADKINIIIEDANDSLQRICSLPIWVDHRAVLFLDPFGMEVDWKTIEAVAATRAIDLWYLFPLSGVNRMLTSSGVISEPWENRLTRLFGTNGWKEAFYRKTVDLTLFGDNESFERCVNFPAIEQFIQARLRLVFPKVAGNPYTLCTRKGTPLFLLCFAVANPSPKAWGAALRIAEHILKMR